MCACLCESDLVNVLVCSDVRRCKKLGDDAMSHIARLTRLQSLKLSECELIGNGGERSSSLSLCRQMRHPFNTYSVAAMAKDKHGTSTG